MTTQTIPQVLPRPSSHSTPDLDSDSDSPERSSLLAIRPQGFHFRPPPPPHDLTTFLTPDSALFQTIHMGRALVDPLKYTLRLDGLVHQPLTLTLPALLALPQTTVTAFHECYGSPLAPPTSFVRRIGNVQWTGVRLSALLALAKVHSETPEAEAGAGLFVWSDGLDKGSFGGVWADRYRKDLPIAKARRPEVLVATRMNGEPLTVERGGPVRLVVPGWFGTNSTKWLCRLRVARGRAKGPYTTRFYNELIPGGREGVTRPVWGVETSSMIVSPEPGRVVEGSRVEVWGWAWGEEEIGEVRVGVDGGEGVGADLVERVEFEWQRFSITVTGLEPGVHSIVACATSKMGASQPVTGRRNHVHTVHITVR